MNKKKLPKGIRFGSVDPYNPTPKILWSSVALDSALSNLGLMYADRESCLDEPFREFRRSEYFTPPTFDECKDPKALYERIAIDFAKYMRDHYK